MEDRIVRTKGMQMDVGSNFLEIFLLILIFAICEAFLPLWTRQSGQTDRFLLRRLLVTYATLYLPQFSIITSCISTREAVRISVVFGTVSGIIFLVGVRKRLNVIRLVTREAASRTAAFVKSAPYS